jgi:phospholipase C
MAFNLQHILVSERLTPETHEAPEGTFFTVAAQGQFQVLYPGRMDRLVSATVRHRTRINLPVPEPPRPPHGIDDPGGHDLGHHPGGGPTPLHNGVVVTAERIPLTLTIFTPDGQPFTKGEVTLADLKKFRDLRGTPIGHWRYTLSGQSKIYVLNPVLNETVSDPEGRIHLSVFETVVSQSAEPLVSSVLLGDSPQSFQFDLIRVGEFVADIVHSSPLDPWRGSMSLHDPDGVRVAATDGKQLRCNIPLAALGKSHGAGGVVRPWSLQVSPQGLGTVVGQPRVTATVLAQGRINTSVMRDRVLALTGPGGSFIKVEGENLEDDIRLRMTITDTTAAETIEMHGLLDKQLEKVGESTDIKPGEAFTLYKADRNRDHDIELDASSIRLNGLEVTVGPGQGLGADVPCVRLAFKAEGSLRATWHGLQLASAHLRDGHAALEVGIRLDPDGTPRVVTWMSDNPFDIDMSAAVVAALVVSLGGIAGGVTAAVIDEIVEDMINDEVAEAVKDLFDDPVLAPKILMMIFGAHLTYREIRIEGDEIVFEHIAPNEANPGPRRNYSEAIGRSVMLEGLGRVRFVPPTLGDTWAAENLTRKIDHIVVVMMENRSYDHVLGYRARGDINDGADGLTDAVVGAVESTDEHHKVRLLRDEAKFPLNDARKRTRIPKGVGHELDDVAQQLAGRINGLGGQQLNDPKGFVDNFREKRLKDEPGRDYVAMPREDGLVPDDVLGYYDGEDLPIFGHLAAHYAYCDRYFCSHPGPTLPNRMYSLTGDVQYDRLGVPILPNNHGDNFLLSRAETIYDVLTKKGVSWRVYESAPSVTMLRMFARYATNHTDIVPLDRLESDVAAGDLPSFTYIEPAMHHHPQDDDHPDADMWRGQAFIRRVYEALRSNPSIWQKTLLIITYDEHGGLYDHVVPPVADIVHRFSPVLSHPGEVTHDLVAEEKPAGRGGPGGRHVGLEHLKDIGSILAGDLVATTDPDVSPPDTPMEMQIPYGVRVPTFVVSPWVAPGKGPDIILDHCSILKTVLARFGGPEKPFLSDRVASSHSFESFLTESEPRLNVPQTEPLAPLPDTAKLVVPGASEIITPPISRKRMREDTVDFHDLSGWVARMIGR